MNKKHILVHTLAFAALTFPAIVLAHGGVDDGHVEDVSAPRPTGASALLVPGSPVWFGIMAFSTVFMSALSYGVYRYIQVAPVEKAKPEEKK